MYYLVNLFFLFHLLCLSLSEVYSPCPTKVLYVERNNNGPPGKRNTWYGSINLGQSATNRDNIITLLLDNVAKLKLKNKSIGVAQIEGGYKLFLNGLSSVEFTVQANPNSAFPNPIGVYLNEQDICYGYNSNEDTIINTPTSEITPHINPTTQIESRFKEEINCGKRKINFEALITNGYPSREGEWPWHAAIFHREDKTSTRYVCGGSLITTQDILTAGHCIIEGGQFIVPQRILVKLGQHNRLLGSKNTQEFQVFNVIPHENFDSSTLKNDIAILKLSTKVIYNLYIQPICLWPKEKVDLSNVINHSGTVIGWGLNEKDELSDILSQAKMPIVDFSTCLESNRDFFGNFLTNYNYCAGHRNGTSVCNGDSGGGMIFEISQTFYIRGIVSLAVAKQNTNLCDSRQYVLFTDVAKYLDWIENHTKN